MKVLFRFAAVLFGAVFVIAAFAGPAAATNFCVPGFFAECPDNGSNIGTQDFSIAASSNASDGQADTIMLDAVDFVSALPMQMSGTDDLTVIGRGRDKSSISTSASTNSYVLQTNGRLGLVTMKDMSIIAPASFPDGPGFGAILQSQKDHFENVDLISENAGSNGASSTIGGGTFTNVRVFGRNGGTVSRAFEAGCSQSGSLVLDQVDLRTTGVAVNANCSAVPVDVSRALIGGGGTPISAASGATLNVTNSVIESGDYSPIGIYNAKGAPTNVGLDQVTVVAVGDNTRPVIQAKVGDVAAATGSIVIAVKNSIFAGFQKSWDLDAPASPARGDITLDLQYSNFTPTGDLAGDAMANLTTGNIDQNPGFLGINDYHLTASSPAVDAGDPDQVQPLVDIEGNGRPIDGNFDGSSVRDMGAYELNPPPPNCPVNPDACVPRISKVKFRYRFGKGGALRLRLSNKSKVIAVFIPVPKKAKPKRKTVRILKPAKAGANVIKLGKRVLKPGRYRLAIRARNDSGDSSKIVIRKIRIKAPK